MGILFVFLHLAFGQGESMTVKEHGKRYKKGGTFFNASICFFALIYTIVSEFFAKDGLFFFPTKIWIYGIASGICYAIGFYGAYLAFKLGSFGKTKLISTFGLVLPIFYGVVFLKETTTIYTYISLALIALSVFLMNYKTLEDDTKAHNTKKWIFPEMELAPGEIKVIFLSGKDKITENGEIHASFKLGSQDSTLLISEYRGKQIDEVAIERAGSGNVSHGRNPNNTSEWLFFAEPTPGFDNTTKGFKRIDISEEKYLPDVSID